MGTVSEAGRPVCDAGDVGELYSRLSARLEQIVRGDVRAPDPVIEDACQFAWSRLVFHSHRVRRDTALPWLVKTAVHEAFKLIHRAGRDLSLDAVLEQAGEAVPCTRTTPLDERYEQRERLDGIRDLPERQQRLVWLHALGLSYAEMAAYEGYSLRTVERQLLRARDNIRRAPMD